MNTAIKMPLHSLNPVVVRDLQEKYPSAVVSIETNEPAESTGMDEERFWDILSRLDWGRKKPDDILAPAVAALSESPEQEIYRFEDVLAEMLFALDGEKYAAGFEGYFSVDAFLYARCCVVANGKRFYEKVLEDPSLMPTDCTFEPLLYLAEKAYQLQNGADDYDYIPAISYETYSNQKGWPGMPSLSSILKGKSA